MTDFNHIKQTMEQTMKQLLKECVEVGSEYRDLWPLDSRARPSTWYLGEDCMIVPEIDTRMLEYYGGFEYVENKYTVSGYTVYSDDDERVREVLAAYDMN